MRGAANPEELPVTDSRSVQQLFEWLLDHPAEARAGRLAELDVDETTRAELASLLEHVDQAGDFLDVAEPAPELDLPFDRLGGVRLTGEIGQGGMGTVYRGVDEASGEMVAIKVLFFGLSRSGTARARFESEGAVMGRLDHPSIVPVRRAGRERGTEYIVMPCVEGTNLSLELDPEQRLGLGPSPGDFTAIASFVADVAEALAHAHDHGVVHRDVKPANILIDRDGRPVLTDFGLARDLDAEGVTRSGDMPGTFQYMSPEQIVGRRDAIGPATDVYSLGAVLYEMLTGARPFAAESTLDVAKMIQSGDPRSVRDFDASIPSDLHIVVGKALETDPAHRYERMHDMARDLRAVARGERITTSPPSAIHRVRKTVRRKRRSIAVAMIVVVMTLVGVFGGRSLVPGSAVPVQLTSEPSGAEVWVRPWDPETGEYGAAVALGRTPTRRDVEPGLVRFVFVDAQGAIAELTRRVPERQDVAEGERVEVEARLTTREEISGDMSEIVDDDFVLSFTDPAPWGAERRDRWTGASFAIDRYEVTMGQYRRFVEETGHALSSYWADGIPDSLLDRPMVSVSWNDARAYAEWAGKRLPTRVEFLRAAGGPDGSMWPWPADSPPADSMRARAAVGLLRGTGLRPSQVRPSHFAIHAVAVGSFPGDRSIDGVFDMLGSASEFVDRPWLTFDMADGSPHVELSLRPWMGSSWMIPAELSHFGVSAPVDAGLPAGLNVGFRCARSLDPLAVLEIVEAGVEESP